jgi:chromosome segregation ATPase
MYNITTTLIYGIAMLFTGLVAFHILSKSNNQKIREGLPSSSLVPSAPNSSNATPPPASSAIPSGVNTTNTKSQSKVSACGDDCSEYDKINAALNDFNKLNSRYEQSDEAVKKVDKDLIQLSKNVRNMGNKKTPGGKPAINNAMLS